jgi:inositol transport system permease protein
MINRPSDLVGRHSIFVVLSALFVICWVLSDRFVSAENLKNISAQISVWTILALGETLLIICGMLDLSSASVLALSGVVSVSVYKGTASLSAAVVVAIAVSVGCNLLNGLMVTKFRTPSFIATLAMMAMARGAALTYTGGTNIYQIDHYIVLGQGRILGIPTPVVFLSGILLATWYILKHTVLGRSIYAVGGNEEAANASGIRVHRVKMQAFAINGVFVGLAGVLYMSRVNEGEPNGAIGYEFKALTAAIIGGTSFSGGIGSASGTIAGAFIVGFLDNIMVLMEVDSYLQQMIRGGIIALAVIYDINAKTGRAKQRLPINTEAEDSITKQSSRQKGVT